MYIADLLNRNNLLQHFGSFVNKNKGKNSDEFLFHASTIAMCILRIHFLNALCITQMGAVKENLTIKDDTIVLWSPTLVELLSLVPMSLASLVVMQNKIFPLLQNFLGLKQSPPSSLNEIMKSLHKYNLPQKTVSYWNKSGLGARKYRDIAEHHYYLLAHSYYQFTPVERVLIYLPDDPNEKNSAKYTFDKKLDCISFLEQSFLDICNYVDTLFSDLGFSKEPIGQTINTNQMVLEEGVLKTLCVMFFDSEGKSGYNIGQTEERRIFIQTFNNEEHSDSAS